MRYKFEAIRLFQELCKKDLTSRDVESFKRIRKSFSMVYPYTFTLENNPKNVPDYEVKSLIFSHYQNELRVVRFHQRYKYMQDFGLWRDYCQGMPALKYYSLLETVRFAEKLESDQRILYNECLKIVRADQARRRRLQKRVAEIVNEKNGYFLTFTFSDEYMTQTNADTRHRNVRRFLKTISDNFVANVDFGKLHDREHYHAVCKINKLTNCSYVYNRKYRAYISYSADELQPCSRWGLYSIRQIRSDEKDIVKVSKYVSKLTNHAIKETTKRNAMIYSR